jgi:signal transduction histidine kinase
VSGPAVPPLIGIGGGVLVVVFGITLVIGVRAAAPVERSRRAQLEFTANASHELRTPLSVVEAEAALALADPAAEDAGAVLGRIAVEGRRLRSIVDGLLWLARRDGEASRPPSSVRDVGAVARGVVARFQPVAVRDGFSLAAEVERRSAPVLAPEDWLERLVEVLLDNACRVTPRGGRIVVTVAGDETQVALRVDDSGPGIPAAERSRIFERFHRADGAEGGAGLGLSIADAIVRDTRGRWEVGESPHGGARMVVRWPAAD